MLFLLLAAAIAFAPDPKDARQRQLAAMAQELERAHKSLQLHGHEAPYFLSYAVRGIDTEHRTFPWDRKKKQINMLLEAYARNQDYKLIGEETARRPLHETVEGPELHVIDQALQDLTWDFEFGVDLLKTLEEADPAHATLLRALNQIINVFASGEEERVERCRRIFKDDHLWLVTADQMLRLYNCCIVFLCLDPLQSPISKCDVPFNQSITQPERCRRECQNARIVCREIRHYFMLASSARILRFRAV